MKPVWSTSIALVILAFATAASAHVVEITTSIPAAKVADDAGLKEALESVIEDAVQHAIAFTPTLVTLQSARRLGDRIYLVLLVVDQDGENMMRQLAADEASASPESSAEPDEADARSL